MANYEWKKNYGYIEMLEVVEEETFFRLKDGETAMNPKWGLYFVPTTHSNYKALVSLLYMAADSHYKTYAQTKHSLVDNYAEVRWLVVDC